MFVWKTSKVVSAESIAHLRKKQNNNFKIGKYKRFVRTDVTDLSSYGFHIFLWLIYETQPSEKYPELMGCDYLIRNYKEDEVFYLQQVLLQIKKDVDKSNKIRHNNKTEPSYIFVNDPNKIILTTHEYEIKINEIVKNPSLNELSIPERFNKLRMPVKPFVDRLDQLILFTALCISNNCGIVVERNASHDKELSNAIFGE